MSATATPTELIARCKWCVARIGKERYRFLGVWHDGLCVPLAHTTFTDGICPECLEIEKATVKHLF